jgi:hypothetical protein
LPCMRLLCLRLLPQGLLTVFPFFLSRRVLSLGEEVLVTYLLLTGALASF